MRGFELHSTSISDLGLDRSRVDREAPARYDEDDIEMRLVWLLIMFSEAPFHGAQVLQKDLALQSQQHPFCRDGIIQQDIRQGVLGAHKVDSSSPLSPKNFALGSPEPIW